MQPNQSCDIEIIFNFILCCMYVLFALHLIIIEKLNILGIFITIVQFEKPMTFAEVQSLICQKCHELIMAYQISLSNPTYLSPKEHNANAFKLEFQGGQELIKTFLLFQTNFDKKRPQQQLSQNNNPFYLLCYAAQSPFKIFCAKPHMHLLEISILFHCIR